MRIGVIGLGAIGGVVAARLMGRQPGLVARGHPGWKLGLAAGRHTDAIERQGHLLLDCKKEVPLRREAGDPPGLGAEIDETLPTLDGPYDLILLCTRTDDTVAALAPAMPKLAADGAVVCLQNGLPEESAGRVAGADRVLGAVIGWSATRDAPGEYVVTGPGSFTLGGASPRLTDAREILSVAFPVKVTDNLAGARWSKLALNCALSTLGAVSGLSLGELAALREVRKLALRVIGEVVEAARAKGVRMEPVAGLRPDLLVQAWPFIGHAAIWLAARKRPNQRTGMIKRLRTGRPAGVEDLNALIDAPLNRRLVEMVREIEQGKRKIDPRNLAELS